MVLGWSWLQRLNQERQLYDKLSCAVSYDCEYLLLSVLQLRRHRHSQTLVVDGNHGGTVIHVH